MGLGQDQLSYLRNGKRRFYDSAVSKRRQEPASTSKRVRAEYWPLKHTRQCQR